ncbi:MAG: hypothetical protein D6729_15895, partial [Deltaproteobacteria bacterium]
AWAAQEAWGRAARAADRSLLLDPTDDAARRLALDAWARSGEAPPSPRLEVDVPAAPARIAVYAPAVAAGDVVAGFLSDLLPAVAAAAFPGVAAPVLARVAGGGPPVARTRPPTLGEHVAVAEATSALAAITGQLSFPGALELFLEVEGDRTPLPRRMVEGDAPGRALVEALQGALEHAPRRVRKGGIRACHPLDPLAEASRAELLALAALVSRRAADPVALLPRLGPLLVEPLVVVLVVAEGKRRLELGEVETARRLAVALEAAVPTAAAPLALLAEVHAHRGQWKEAARRLEAAAGRRAPGQVTEAEVGRAWERAGARGRAAVWYRRAAGSEARAVAAEGHAALGDLYLAAHRVTDARAHFEAALERVQGHPRARAGLARIAAIDGDRDAFARHLAGALGRLPLSMQEALLDEAADLLLPDRARAFLELAKEAAAGETESALVIGAYAVAVLRAAPREAEAAARKVEAALARHPPGPVAERLASLLADLWCEVGARDPSPSVALKAYERALSVHPEHGPAHVGVGAALVTLGRADEALRYLTVAPGLEGSGREAWLHLARAWYAVGRFEHARLAAERAGDLAWRHPELRALLEVRRG